MLPVRVIGYPENDRTEDDTFYIQDAVGRDWVWLVRRDDADEIAAALNDHSALQAQVAALAAERDEANARVATVLRREDALAAEIAGLTDARERMQVERDRLREKVERVRGLAAECLQRGLLRDIEGTIHGRIGKRIRAIVGDAAEGKGGKSS